MQLKSPKITLNIKLCLGHRMGGYPILSLMPMFNCTHFLTVSFNNRPSTENTLKKDYFSTSAKIQLIHCMTPSGVTTLFVLFTWHNLIGKAGWGVAISKKTRNTFLSVAHERETTVLPSLTVPVLLEVSSSLFIRNMQNPIILHFLTTPTELCQSTRQHFPTIL